MLVSFLRTLILYIVVIFGMRIMGKRQLGQLQPSELVITILISNIATLPIENSDVPLILGIIPILTLMCFEVILSVLTLKSIRFRRLIWGNTKILIQDGKIKQQELADLRYSVDDLMEQLRSKDVFELADVEYAILETNGELSVLLKGPQQTPTYQALHIPSPEARPPFMLVQDGEIHHEALSQAGYDETWLHKQLKKGGAACIDDVFFAFLGSDGILHIQRKHETGGEAVYIHTEKKGTEKEK